MSPYDPKTHATCANCHRKRPLSQMQSRKRLVCKDKAKCRDLTAKRVAAMPFVRTSVTRP